MESMRQKKIKGNLQVIQVWQVSPSRKRMILQLLYLIYYTVNEKVVEICNVVFALTRKHKVPNRLISHWKYVFAPVTFMFLVM